MEEDKFACVTCFEDKHLKPLVESNATCNCYGYCGRSEDSDTTTSLE